MNTAFLLSAKSNVYYLTMQGTLRTVSNNSQPTSQFSLGNCRSLITVLVSLEPFLYKSPPVRSMKQFIKQKHSLLDQRIESQDHCVAFCPFGKNQKKTSKKERKGVDRRGEKQEIQAN